MLQKRRKRLGKTDTLEKSVGGAARRGCRETSPAQNRLVRAGLVTARAMPSSVAALLLLVVAAIDRRHAAQAHFVGERGFRTEADCLSSTHAYYHLIYNPDAAACFGSTHSVFRVEGAAGTIKRVTWSSGADCQGAPLSSAATNDDGQRYGDLASSPCHNAGDAGWRRYVVHRSADGTTTPSHAEMLAATAGNPWRETFGAADCAQANRPALEGWSHASEVMVGAQPGPSDTRNPAERCTPFHDPYLVVPAHSARLSPGCKGLLMFSDWNCAHQLQALPDGACAAAVGAGGAVAHAGTVCASVDEVHDARMRMTGQTLKFLVVDLPPHVAVRRRAAQLRAPRGRCVGDPSLDGDERACVSSCSVPAGSYSEAACNAIGAAGDPETPKAAWTERAWTVETVHTARERRLLPPEDWTGPLVRMLEMLAAPDAGDFSFALSVLPDRARDGGVVVDPHGPDPASVDDALARLGPGHAADGPDAVLAPVLAAPARTHAVDLTSPFLSSPPALCVPVRRAGWSESAFAWARGFSPGAWAAVLASACAAACVFLLVDPRSPDFFYRGDLSAAYDGRDLARNFEVALWLALGALVRGPSRFRPRTTLGRAVALAWSFASLVALCVFVANLSTQVETAAVRAAARGSGTFEGFRDSGLRACVYERSPAVARWIRRAWGGRAPEARNGPVDMVGCASLRDCYEAVARGRCDGVVGDLRAMTFLARSGAFCDEARADGGLADAPLVVTDVARREEAGEAVAGGGGAALTGRPGRGAASLGGPAFASIAVRRGLAFAPADAGAAPDPIPPVAKLSYWIERLASTGRLEALWDAAVEGGGCPAPPLASTGRGVGAGARPAVGASGRPEPGLSEGFSLLELSGLLALLALGALTAGGVRLAERWRTGRERLKDNRTLTDFVLDFQCRLRGHDPTDATKRAGNMAQELADLARWRFPDAVRGPRPGRAEAGGALLDGGAPPGAGSKPAAARAGLHPRGRTIVDAIVRAYEENHVVRARIFRPVLRFLKEEAGFASVHPLALDEPACADARSTDARSTNAALAGSGRRSATELDPVEWSRNHQALLALTALGPAAARDKAWVLLRATSMGRQRLMLRRCLEAWWTQRLQLAHEAACARLFADRAQIEAAAREEQHALEGQRLPSWGARLDEGANEAGSHVEMESRTLAVPSAAAREVANPIGLLDQAPVSWV
jgi:hypothetical protein